MADTILTPVPPYLLTDSIKIEEVVCESETLQSDTNGRCCLICSQLLSSDYNDNDYNFQNIPNLNTSEAVPSLNDDLASIFALKLLNFPNENCEHILQRTSGVASPGQWFLLCRSCCQFVEEAFSLERKLAKLNYQLTTLKSAITNNLIISFGKEEDDEGQSNEIFDIPKYIRSFFKKELFTNYFVEDNHMMLPVISTNQDYTPKMESDKIEDKDNAFIPTEEEQNWVCSSDNEYDHWKPSKSKRSFRHRKGRNLSNTHKTSHANFTTNMKINSKSIKSRRRLKNTKSDLNTEVKTYQCDICNSVFANGKTKFDIHMRKHRMEKKREMEEKIKCGKCDFISKSFYQAEMHLSIHVTENVDMSQAPENFICKICHKSFKTVLAAKKHVSKDHKSELGVTLHQCDICPNSYLTEKNLRNHILQSHKNDECQHRCDQCGAGFTNRIRMENHRAKHFNSVPHIECDLCGLRFTSNQGMRNHKKKYHCEKKPEDTITTTTATVRSQGSERSCNHCNIVCVNLRGLKEHWKSAHPELYKFKCNLCEAVYISKLNLKIHVRAEHLKEKVECAKCGAKVSCASIGDHNRKYCKFR